MTIRWTFGLLFLAPALPAQAQLHPRPTTAPVIRPLDPRFGALVPAGAKVEKLVEGRQWVEGPVWVPGGGYLLFSDVVANAIYRWKEGEGARVFLGPQRLRRLGSVRRRRAGLQRARGGPGWPARVRPAR